MWLRTGSTALRMGRAIGEHGECASAASLAMALQNQMTANSRTTPASPIDNDEADQEPRDR